MGANILQDRLSLPSVHAQSVWTFNAKPEAAILLSEAAIYSISQMQSAGHGGLHVRKRTVCVQQHQRFSHSLKWVLQISSALLYLHGSAQKLPCMYLIKLCVACIQA